MIEPRFVVSSPSREKALAYIVESLQSSLLAQQLGTVFPEKGALALVTASDPPAGVDYFTDWSKSSCTDWLINEIANYVKFYPNSIVLFEDIVAAPSDPYLSAHDHPPFWCYQGRVFWPVTPSGNTEHTVEQAIAWCAGFRTIAGFSSLPNGVSLPFRTHLLSQTDFQHIASSITRLVTDVFDGGGYMVWERDK
jgi:hypothetical protein